MILAAFLCALGVALIFAGLYVAAGKREHPLWIAARVLAPAAILLLALISGNLSSFGGYAIFVCIALALFITLPALSNIKDTISQIITNSVVVLSLVSLIGAGCCLTAFNIFGLLMGLLLGLGISFIIILIKHTSIIESIFTSLILALSFAIFGQAIVILMSGHLLTLGIMNLAAALLFATSQILEKFKGDKMLLQIFTDLTYILALTLFAASIFFI